MKWLRRIWRVGWRFMVCGFLLVWILHTIFLSEARTSAESRGQDWSQLTMEQKGISAWRVGPAELWKTLTLVEPLWLTFSLVCLGVTLLIGAVRWHSVLHVTGLRLPFARTLEISLVSHFFNSFLLGSTGGDLFKAYYAARETHHRKTEAVVAVVADRLIGLFAMLLFATVMILVHLDLLTRHRPLMAASLLIVGMLVICGGVLGLSFWGGSSRIWPKARIYLHSLPKGAALERTLNACRIFGREVRVLVITLGLSMLLNVVCVLQFMALARGLDLHLPASQFFLIVPVVICVAALPVTPSGLGLRENLFVVLLAHPSIGVQATQALSLSLLAFAGSLAWSLLGGLVYLAFRQRPVLSEAVQAR